MNRIETLKNLDRTLGGLLASVLPRPVLEKREDLARILVIRPGGIGDAVLLLPTLRLIRHAYPACEIEILAERRNAGLFLFCPMVNQVFLYDNWRHLVKLIRRRYDLIIDTEQWHRLSAVIARILPGSRKIGFATNNRARMFTDAVQYSQELYERENFLNLVAPLGLGYDSIMSPFLEIPEESNKQAIAHLAGLQGNFIVLFPGASVPERQWGRERFAALAAQLAQTGKPVVVVGGGMDYSQGEAIAAQGHGLNLAGATTLAETAAIIKHSILLVSGDSGILHLAVGLDVPTVSLFGPGRALKWAPRGERHVVLNKNLPCSPCTTFGYTPQCRENARCISEITVDEVFEAVLGLLKTKKV